MEVTILWAGGWDDLVIDPTQIRGLTDEEGKEMKSFPYQPFVGQDGLWLRCNFLKGELCSDHQVVKIVRFVKHGD